MKNKFALSAVSAVLLLISNQAVAFDKGTGYVGAQYAMFSVEPSGLPDFDIPALIVRGGYFFNKHFSIEGRLGFGIGDDTQDVLGYRATVELDNLYGIYGVGHLPLSQRVDLYGVIGYSKGESSASITAFPGVVETGDDSDLSIGVGADFLLTDAFSLNIEYMSYISKSDGDANALAFGVNYYF